MAVSRASSNHSRLRWARWLLFFLAVVGFVKIVFLTNIYTTLDSSFLAVLKRSEQGKETLGRKGGATSLKFGDELSVGSSSSDKVTAPVDDICEDWLEKEDRILYSRNFSKDPIWVVGEEKDSISRP